MTGLGARRRAGKHLLLQMLFIAALLAGAETPAFAAPPSQSGTPSTTGYDLSYPQCGRTFPSAPAFGIVGVNGGLANDINACFGPSASYPSYKQSELYWAVASSTGATTQPKASLYVNTADPGDVYNGNAIADWPTSSSGTDPFGTCTTTTVVTNTGPANLGANSPACAWQYGYNKAAQDVSWLGSAAGSIDAQQSTISISVSPSSYWWWLDVETSNTWQPSTSGDEMNVADLQGMVAALDSFGVTTVGAYSTSSQWIAITGGTASSTMYGLTNSLYGIPNWIPGAKSESGAAANCTQPSFTIGRVSVTQWSGRFDSDHAC